MIDEIKSVIAKAATKVIKSQWEVKLKSSDLSLNDVEPEEIEIEIQSNSDFGDYSSKSALTLYAKFAKLAKSHSDEIIWVDVAKNSSELAKRIIENIDSNLFEKVEVAGPGFINIWLKRDILVDGLIQIDSVSDSYGKNNVGDGKIAIVEYSSPNIAKPFGVGHLRSTVIGDAIANLMEFSGYKVLRDNHLGDWGTQFGKVITAIKKWGDEDIIEKSSSPVEELMKLYVKFHDESKIDASLEDEARNWFKKLEDGDLEARRLWQKCVDWSFVEFEKIYNHLNIKFAPEFNNGRGLGESFFESRMNAVVQELTDKKLLKSGENGAKLVFFEDDKYPPLMVLKSDGTTLYATRDLATDKYRLEKYNPDLVVNEVGSEQSLYFKQLFELEKILGWYKEGQRVHVGHGLFLMDGKKMSTRAGKTIKLEDVLSEAIERARKMAKVDDSEASRKVGIGAIKYFDLSHHPATNINFDWDSMFNMDGNSSPYIQYTYARCKSVLEKSNNSNFVKEVKKDAGLNPEERLISSKLFHFPEVVQSAATSYSPNILCNYLFELASKYNSFYNQHKIIGGENENLRLLLSKSVAQVIKNGLNILGIETPERM